MNRETTRRALLGAVLGAGVAGGFLTGASTRLGQFAPLSGSVWGAARTGRQSTVDSPHGPAEVSYDDEGVPHVSADDEAALYFAAGYVQTTDRVFQMDLQRRLVRGQLSAVVGDATLDSDEFNRKMLFGEAAEATAEHVRETPAGPPAEAYVDGVNAAIDRESLPVEFRLLDYEPDEWTLADSMVIEKLLAWNLTGSFRTLRKALLADTFGPEMADQLYPDRFDERPHIIRDHHDPDTFGAGLGIDPDEGTERAATRGAVDRDTVDWLAAFEPAPTLGSNSWVVGPGLSGGNAPVLSNDPHLGLQAPPTWYEMHLDGPDHRVRGVTFPGVPFVVIGENDHGAWGFTNVGADVIDFYTYETGENGRTYAYGDQTREFDTETREIEVAGGANEEIEVKQSVHGPVIEEADQEVGVAWTGHAATETTLAIYELTHSEGVEDVRSAGAKFEAPTQNLLYGSTDGNSLFHVVGRLPVRRIDDSVVRGDRVFDGSAREGEWGGFAPFERPDAWDRDPTDTDELSWVPFAENPHVENPDYLATANQLTVDDDRLAYYLGVDFDPGYRGERIYDLLDERIETGADLDLGFLRAVGRDTRSGRAATLVDGLDDDGVDGLLEAAREADGLADAADTLAAWDYRMDPDSEGALLFDRWMDHYREELFAEAFEAADLDEDDYSPRPGAVAQLPPDSRWFAPRGRAATMRAALRGALAEIDDEGHDVYGDVSHTGHIGHPLELDFLAYPEHPRGGSGETVQNFDSEGPRGGSWEMQVDLDGEYLAILPGGNSGRYFSTHYDDQIARWARGEYRSLSRDLADGSTVEFQGGDG